MRRPTIAKTAHRLIARGLKIVLTHTVNAAGVCTCPAGAACRSTAKHPDGQCAPNGYHDASDDPSVVGRWLAMRPNAGIAVAAAASGLVVLDVDPRSGGAETVAAMRAVDDDFAAALDATVQVLSQGGGWHFYFLAAPGVRYPSSLGPGVDVKHRGLVMVPPSHGAQGQYVWAPRRSIFECDPLPAAGIDDVLRAQPFASSRDSLTGEPPDAAALRDLQAALMVLDHNDRATWIKVGYALWTAGQCGEHLWFDWSRRSLKYDNADAISTWDSFANSESHWRAVFTYAQEAADAWFARLKTKRK